MHPYVVSTKALKVGAAIATAADLKGLLQPGALQGFELQIPVNTFTSDKDGLTKQMFKAMKADKHPTITFRLNGYTVEPAAAGVTVKPTGTLTVAGVEKPIDMVLDVKEVGRRAAGARNARPADDRLRHQAADDVHGHAEDRRQGHHHVRTSTRSRRQGEQLKGSVMKTLLRTTLALGVFLSAAALAAAQDVPAAGSGSESGAATGRKHHHERTPDHDSALPPAGSARHQHVRNVERARRRIQGIPGRLRRRVHGAVPGRCGTRTRPSRTW